MANMKPYEFESERLFFSEINDEDAAVIVRWRSLPDVNRYFAVRSAITMESHLRWFHAYQEDPSRIEFVFRLKSSGQKIGTAGLRNIDRASRCAEVNYMIGESGFRGKGLAKEAVTALLLYAFRTFGIISYTASVDYRNTASLKMIESAGFRLAGSPFLEWHYIMTGQGTDSE